MRLTGLAGRPHVRTGGSGLTGRAGMFGLCGNGCLTTGDEPPSTSLGRTESDSLALEDMLLPVSAKVGGLLEDVGASVCVEDILD